MGRSTLLNTDTEDLKELLSNGKTYAVPPYQRDYSWKIGHWEDLWEDIRGLEGDDGDHYMGAIVLQSHDRKKFQIIDGQQRIATLSILVLACIAFLRDLRTRGIDAESNEHRATLLESAFIGAKDPVSLRVVSKLHLNASDDKFYQLNLSQHIPPAGSVRNLSDSEKLMWDCFQFFRAKLAEHFRANPDGGTIAEFINVIVSERLLFIIVRVQDELSAYSVFETLNARGLELTETDLLKNYLLSLADRLSKGQMAPLLDQWNRITDRVGSARLPVFLRHHLNSRRSYVRQKGLFKIIRDDVEDMPGVFALLRDLEVDAAWYQALGDHNDQFWLDYPGAREHVRVLNLFRITQYAPLVLAAKDRFNIQDVVEVLRYCAVVSFRFNGVSRRSAHSQEEVYNKASLAIRNGSATNLHDIRRLLAPIYISDEEFEADFATLALKANGQTGKRLRYILCQLEKQIDPKELNDEIPTSATIEHILPENPAESWNATFSNSDMERFLERLGNYTLLEKQLNNREAANRSFEQKLPIYRQSRFALSNGIQYEEWSPAAIQERQSVMARCAKTVWKLDIPMS